MRRRLRLTAGIALLLAALVYLNNTPRFSGPRTGSPRILVHRGMAQRFNLTTFNPDNCTAAQMLPPQHEYLENTIPSMRAAFDRGAYMVEFDINVTRDDRFAVFHDRSLDCRTNGRGLIREHRMEELAPLDVGYGYTADKGRTFPLRGRGVGLLVSMDEVFKTFPDKSFLIDIKGNDPKDGALLGVHLSKLTPEHRSRIMVFGRETTLEGLREKLPEIRNFSTESITNCLVRYIAYGWTGMTPGACSNAPVFVPINVMPWLWGWPNKFMERFERQGSSIIVMGPLGGRDFPAGVDSIEQFDQLPKDFNGGIWTNNVELIGGKHE